MKTKTVFTFVTLILTGIVIVAIVLFSPKGISNRISKDASREECIRTAEEFLQQNQPESAIYPLLLAVQKDQRDFMAHLLLAQAYFRTDVYPLAEKECQSSLELNPGNRETTELLCLIKLTQGKSNWEKEDYLPAISEFMYVLKESRDQKLIDSIAQLTGGKFRIQRLTHDLFPDDAPSFSPDGKRIIYHSDTSFYLEDYGLRKIQTKKSRIFVMDPDGRNRTCLSPEGENETSEQFARFSHDNKFIVYEKENSPPHAGDTSFNCDRDIFFKSLDSGRVRRLTDTERMSELMSSSTFRVMAILPLMGVLISCSKSASRSPN